MSPWTFSGSTARIVSYGRCEHTDKRGRCRTDASILVADFTTPATRPRWMCDKHSPINARRRAA